MQEEVLKLIHASKLSTMFQTKVSQPQKWDLWDLIKIIFYLNFGGELHSYLKTNFIILNQNKTFFKLELRKISNTVLYKLRNFF